MTHRTTRLRRTPHDTASADAERHDRFGTLPERIRPEDTVETSPATRPDSARDRYHADEWLVRYCG
ncbi:MULTISPECIES: hypothetical protein [unclassified Streptomyces]|uniref:hypothetical protein n=1 Tax=unclassified Streptomyces TaxID=2593676 RepID=UPI001369E65F|nr:hypothetical protein [Streptomyces sp. SID4985]MYQ45915.1 hypothetical protein [Streptomyces sp. SID4985]